MIIALKEQLINLRNLVRKFLLHLEFRQIQFGEIFSKHKVEISEECIQALQMLASTFQTDLRPFTKKLMKFGRIFFFYIPVLKYINLCHHPKESVLHDEQCQELFLQNSST